MKLLKHRADDRSSDSTFPRKNRGLSLDVDGAYVSCGEKIHEKLKQLHILPDYCTFFMKHLAKCCLKSRKPFCICSREVFAIFASLHMGSLARKKPHLCCPRADISKSELLLSALWLKLYWFAILVLLWRKLDYSRHITHDAAHSLAMTHSPSICNLALFTLFMSLVSNLVNTNDITEVIFSRWRTHTKAHRQGHNTAQVFAIHRKSKTLVIVMHAIRPN